jgi:hypothetical protein
MFTSFLEKPYWLIKKEEKPRLHFLQALPLERLSPPHFTS